MKIDSFRELCRDGKVNCETCLFRMRLSDSSHGECHYYPPRPIVYERTDRRLDLTDFENDLEGVPHELLRTDEEDQWEYSLAAWPKTDRSGYCGHWEANVDCALEIGKLNRAAPD